MNNIPLVNPERKVQNRIINLLHDYCGYAYLGSFQDTENQPILEDRLKKFLMERQGATSSQADKVYNQLRTLYSGVHDKDSLYLANKEIYDKLRNGSDSVPRPDGHGTERFEFIDWDDPSNNDYAIAEEVTVRRNIEEWHTRRPDVVVYINGIAVAIIELKKATVSVKDGIRQNIRNHKDTSEISFFFAPAQFLFAGSESEGLYYGTILTPEKFWLRWKEPTGEGYPKGCTEPDPFEVKFSQQDFQNELDRSLLQMLDPQRFLTLIHDCVVYDGGIKKVARPNQYFALEAAKPRIRRKDSGIIWHSQGAGKSLMMVWLAQWITENMPGDPRVVIITDRDELDKQIENGFIDAGEKPVRAKSGDHLLRLLSYTDPKNPNPKIITTLIHKYGIAGQEETVVSPEDRRLRGKRSPEQYMSDLTKRLPRDFRAKGSFFVFVDECHRTQSGVLNRAMKAIMGDDVMLIGFTGTPLLRADKQKLTSRENFGGYIHTYKFNEAVDDKVVLDLRYEARDIEQNLGDQEAIDQLFEARTRGLSPRAKEQLQKRWAIMKNIFSSRDRVNKLVANICLDMELIPCLREGWGNAMLVCDSIYQAFRAWEAFQNTPLKDHCAVVSSYGGQDIGLDEVGGDETESEAEYKKRMSEIMFAGKDPEEFEEWAKNEFINHPGKMKLLIVVNKLLTGFDAPTATYLYLDKKMEGHDLFQAICRVNRPDSDHESKEFGYIVDYKELFKNIENAVSDYTNGALKDFDKQDVQGLLNDRFEEGKRDLDAALERCRQLSEPVEMPREIDDFFNYFVFDQRTTPPEEQQAEAIKTAIRREAFYNAVHTLVRRYTALSLDMERAGYTPEEANAIFAEVKNFDNLRIAIGNRSGDIIDMKRYDHEMRSLLDNYVEARNAKVLAMLEDFSFLDLIDTPEGDAIEGEAEEILGGQEGVATTITANVRRVINRKRDSNPEEYRRFSERLNRLLEERRQGVLGYKEMLKAIAELAKELNHRNSDPRINTPGKQALYDYFNQDIDFTLSIDQLIRAKAKRGFRENETKKLKLLRAIKEGLTGTDYDPNDVLNLAINNHEYAE